MDGVRQLLELKNKGEITNEEFVSRARIFVDVLKLPSSVEDLTHEEIDSLAQQIEVYLHKKTGTVYDSDSTPSEPVKVPHTPAMPTIAPGGWKGTAGVKPQRGATKDEIRQKARIKAHNPTPNYPPSTPRHPGVNKQRMAFAETFAAAGFPSSEILEKAKDLEIPTSTPELKELTVYVDSQIQMLNEITSNNYFDDIINSSVELVNEIPYEVFENAVSSEPYFPAAVESSPSFFQNVFNNPVADSIKDKAFGKVKEVGLETLSKHGVTFGAEAGIEAAGTAAAGGSAAAGTAAAATAGGTAAATASGATAAAGALGGPVGAAIAAGAVVAYKKVIKPLFKKLGSALSAIGIEFKRSDKYLFGAIAAGGILLGTLFSSVPLVAIGAVAAVPAVAGGAAVVAGGVSLFFTIVIARTIATIGGFLLALVLAFFGVIVFTAFTLFIINSGAYVVPPGNTIVGTDIGNITSQYIGVTKGVSQTTFSNSDLPITVTYTVTVSAKKGPLTNVEIADSCSVISRSGNPSCDHVINVEMPTVIDPGNPFVFDYSTTYSGSEFGDSYIINTITVTADVAEAVGEQASASANVLVGDPPTGCFIFNETIGVFNLGGGDAVYSLGWNNYPAKRAKVLYGISYLMRSSQWFARTCSAGPITLTHAQQVSNYGGWAPNISNLVMYSTEGLGYGENSTLYTFAHEVGHLIHYRNGDIISAYMSMAAGEGYLPTYPLKDRLSIGEDIPETISVYAVSPVYPNVDVNMEVNYPGHYAFGKYVYGIEF